MWIDSLNINYCRSLDNVSINLSETFNIIVGKNASGKTSLLEAINVLSSGRSFRTNHISDVISYNEQSIIVHAKVRNNDTISQIGIEKNLKSTRIRINKKNIFSQAELSAYLPITIIHPGSIELITGSPRLRRAYIDWLTFYLFPDYHQKWKQYQHILKQRNLCLKDPKHHYAIDQWTVELIGLQPGIHQYRKEAFDLLKPKLESISETICKSNITLEYSTGFPPNVKMDVESLLSYYRSKKEHDIKFKRTTSGIHRADFKVRMNKKSAAKTASRGQLKLISIALYLAQNKAIENSTIQDGVLIIDDLASELDSKNMDNLLNYLITLNKQIIITSTKVMEQLNNSWKVFHVKHGKITEK